jgi:glycosyltransferase involved in cell wall biosynthesis
LLEDCWQTAQRIRYELKTTFMVLSILIPVYNWDIIALLEKLIEEIDNSIEDEIQLLVIDDCSTDNVLSSANYSFACNNQRPYFEYLSLEQNAGRSAVRNLLASKARGEYLLFMDCDVLPDSPRFIQNYLNSIKQKYYDVVCGGRSYIARVLKEKEYDFHVYFGNKKEVKPAVIRNKEPWRFILTSNVMVSREAFNSTPFNERFIGYGYEDVEWGIRLSRNYRILHIENSASHIGLQTKSKMYEKMRESVQNYLLLGELYPEAYTSATISTFATFFSLLPSRLLCSLDVCFRRFFLHNSFGCWLSFISFQLGFSVLMGLAHAKKHLAGGTRG